MDTNPKCSCCKCFWKPDETDVKSSGLVAKTCKRCRELAKQKNKKYYNENAEKLKEQKKNITRRMLTKLRNIGKNIKKRMLKN